ncbi:hypothetical protein DsansV1_C07g0074211 [Dioscorea sansibarensis]
MLLILVCDVFFSFCLFTKADFLIGHIRFCSLKSLCPLCWALLTSLCQIRLGK